MQAMLRIRAAYGKLLEACGWFAGCLTFAVMILGVTNVGGRYLLNAPVKGALEVTEAALPLMIFLSLALTQYHGGHIRVSMVTDRLPEMLQRMLFVLSLFAGAVIFAWATWAGWLSAEKSFSIGEMQHGSLRFPLWPIRFAVAVGMALLTIQFLIDMICVALGVPLPTSDPEHAE